MDLIILCMNFITNTFEQNMLLFKDTDSLVYEIETDDVMKIFMKTRICLI